MTYLIALIIALLSWGLSAAFPALPWYSAVIVAFLAGLASGGYKVSGFLAGFLGIGLFWGLASGWAHWQNDGIATGRMAALFSGEMGATVSPVVLLVVTASIGALLGGAAALSGKLFAGPGPASNRYARKHRNQRRKGFYKLRID